jgi:menaquinol-cytochrome c reductase iron-sulfur subunit
MQRRTFLSRLTAIFSVLTASLISLPLVRFLFASTTHDANEGWYRLTRIDGLDPDDVSRVRYLRVIREGWQSRLLEEVVWVRKKKDGSVIVFDTHCTHLGCAVSWDSADKKFKCPCHGGVFDANGKRIEGPPPSPLHRYETRVDNGNLLIGKILKS